VLCESVTLVVALLAVESSYIKEIERPSSKIPDTVQFWISPSSGSWRIRTFAIDHDIHVYRIGDKTSLPVLSVEQAKQNIRKSYGDVIKQLEVICISNPKYSRETELILHRAGMPGVLEVSELGFAYLNPDRGAYKTQSKPK
jgi:hypothetical protein